MALNERKCRPIDDFAAMWRGVCDRRRVLSHRAQAVIDRRSVFPGAQTNGEALAEYAQAGRAERRRFLHPDAQRRELERGVASNGSAPELLTKKHMPAENIENVMITLHAPGEKAALGKGASNGQRKIHVLAPPAGSKPLWPGHCCSKDSLGATSRRCPGILEETRSGPCTGIATTAIGLPTPTGRCHAPRPRARRLQTPAIVVSPSVNRTRLMIVVLS